MFLCQRDHGLYKRMIQGVDAAFTLHHFKQYSRHVALGQQAGDFITVVGSGIEKTFGQGKKILMKGILSRGRQGGDGSAVKAVFQGDDVLAGRAVCIFRIFAGGFDGAFVGFRPGIGEKHFLHAGSFTQHVGKAGARFGII